MEQIDYLPNHKELKIIQDPSSWLINSDTMLLGEYINIKHKDRVLDVGTNNGSLILYASLFQPKEIIGIDINKRALELASKNIELNNIKNAKVIYADITSYKFEKEFDLIIANPPYFKTEDNNKSKKEDEKIAKHEDKLTLKTLIKGISTNLRDGGSLYMLYKTSRLDEVIIELKKNNINIKEMKFVYDENKNTSHVFMFKGVKNSKQGLQVNRSIALDRTSKKSHQI